MFTVNKIDIGVRADYTAIQGQILLRCKLTKDHPYSTRVDDKEDFESSRLQIRQAYKLERHRYMGFNDIFEHTFGRQE